MLLRALKYVLVPKLRQWRRNRSENQSVSFAQCGEDLILRYLLTTLGISKVTYLDVGAHHPTYLSNTYLFYSEGGSGVCVEPDPSLSGEFARKRPRDVTLDCGVGTANGVADFFILSTTSLNTFSRAEAERYESYGTQRIMQAVPVEVKTINDIIEHNFARCPNLVSLDVEGLDYAVLSQFDFTKYRPEVFCVETLSYTEDKSERKLAEIIDLMHARGYMTYADTYINTIFVDARAWQGRVS